MKQEVSTRWNSTLLMFERLLETKEPLISTLALTNPNLESLSENEWDIISKACEVLKLFKEITPEMCYFKPIILSQTILKHTAKVRLSTNIAETVKMCEKI